MQVIDINMVAAQSLQTGFAFMHDVPARIALLIWSLAHWKAHLGAYEHLSRFAFQHFTQGFLRFSGGINIGGVEQIDPGVDGDIDQTLAILDRQASRHAEKTFAGEVHCPHCMQRNL